MPSPANPERQRSYHIEISAGLARRLRETRLAKGLLPVRCCAERDQPGCTRHLGLRNRQKTWPTARSLPQRYLAHSPRE